MEKNNKIIKKIKFLNYSQKILILIMVFGLFTYDILLLTFSGFGFIYSSISINHIETKYLEIFNKEI